MKQNKSKILKIIIKYVFLFLIFLVFTLILSPVNIDEIWNYGFSYNIYKGLIPYKDFNMVLTPLYPMIMAGFLHIFGKGILSIHIVNAIILCFSSHLLFKMYGKKAYLIIILFFLPFYLTFPSYNTFLVVLTIILIFLEKEKKDNKNIDYLIGVVLGLLILTKQTVGFCVLIGSMIYAGNKNKIGKRVAGCLIPILVFTIYLIATNSYSQFFDLCFLGLLDFSKNSQGFNVYTIITIILLLINIYLIVKEKDKLAYYSLFFSSITIPICDLAHLSPYLVIISNFIIPKIKKDLINYKALFVSSVLIASILVFSDNYDGAKSAYPNDLNNFNYRYISKTHYDLTKKILNWMDGKKEQIIFLDANAYYFRLIRDEKIGYIDLINQGNWGYHGSKKLLKTLSQYKNTYFFINKEDYKSHNQIDKNTLEYIFKNGEKKEEINCYEIYYIK